MMSNVLLSQYTGVSDIFMYSQKIYNLLITLRKNNQNEIEIMCFKKMLLKQCFFLILHIFSLILMAIFRNLSIKLHFKFSSKFSRFFRRATPEMKFLQVMLIFI